MTSSHSSSSSSTESTSSSGSSSCSDTGSTTTDTDSSTSCENKPNTSATKTNETKTNNKSSQATNLRRKSCETKVNPNSKLNDLTEKGNTGKGNKTSTSNLILPQKQTKTKSLSQIEDTTVNKKQTTHSTAITAKSNEVQDKSSKASKLDKEKSTVLSAESDVSEKNPIPRKKVKPTDASKVVETNSKTNSNTTQNKGRPAPKSRSTNAQTSIKSLTNNSTKRKCSIESDCDSASELEEYASCSTSVETDNDSDSSYSTKTRKGKRSKRTSKATNHTKRTNSETDDELNAQQNLSNRKLTRSFSSKHNERHIKSASLINTRNTNLHTDTDTDPESIKDIKHHVSKSPSKKSFAASNSFNKSKTKKDSSNYGVVKNRIVSPVQVEKKCPIEGCDSSGHLSGHLDRHFLPEACPIYHNMSVSECKERANERKLRQEIRANANSNDDQNPRSTTTSKYLQTAEQKEFLNNIRESRMRFKPIADMLNSDKIALEKDCNDKDREPSLVGLVPDYDLQLFREAQALASETIEEDHKDLPIGKGIKYITMGKYKMKVWYQSPYPDDVARLPQMYICEFCLRYQKSETGIKRHAQKCVWRHPPGDEIYRKGKLQVWQVDGKRHKQYCQHLCLLAKFFLDHKTLYYDVEPFLFYIMTLADVDGCHTVGYFSKEKNSFYNVSCILTLPPYQRKGYGRLLIDFSYLLTRVEGKIGSPEKPLSDLGLISYRSYWKDVLLDYLCNRSGNTLSIKDVSQEMAIYSYDIVSTLQALGMMKYWKGKHIVLKKQDVLDEYEERIKRRGTFPKIDESCLRWIPFVPTQTNNSP